MKKTIVLILLILLQAFLQLATATNNPITSVGKNSSLQAEILANNSPNQKINAIKVMVYGDSLSAAYNIPVEKGWVSLLQNFVSQNDYDINFINASISGETTVGGLQRLPSLLQKHQPDIVILELGANDGLRALDLKQTANNLNQMITMIQNNNAKILLLGMQIPPNYGRTYTRRFKQMYFDIAEEKNVELLPFFLEKVATKPELMQQDRLHPNEKGQPIIMETIWHYLKPIVEKNETHLNKDTE
ncbi:MAG: arylesterase [Gammaproteobacteria bacterium]|nr:arylesterase [Gammaproteobacteria bacterium]MDH5630630.1 arylesterase [Gammaproteobacteria bacterium]